MSVAPTVLATVCAVLAVVPAVAQQEVAKQTFDPPLRAEMLRAAFRALDARLEGPLTLVVGGGTAMMLAYGLPVRTTDVDAYPARGRLEDIAPKLRAVARELGLAPDWVNPHYETFAHVLPGNYGSRLKEVHGASGPGSWRSATRICWC